MGERIKRDTKAVGDISEVTVLGALVRMGYRVSIPYGENQRYDFVAENGGVFFRIQVKTGRLRKGTVMFNCCSSHAHRGGKQRGYIGEIELFGVYCPDIDRVFLVPVNDVTTGRGNLRWEPPRNSQNKKIRWAMPYVLPVWPPQVGVERHGVVAAMP